MRRLNAKLTTLAGVMVVAGGLAGSSHAQQFTLQLASSPADVNPGREVVVNLLVSGGPTDTAAINYTVAAENASGGNLVSSITGTKSGLPGLANFVYADNAPTRTEGREYRGVLYAPSSAVAPISTAASTHVATLRVAISSAATDGSAITLKVDRVGGTNGFDSDAFTATRGIANAAGVSVVPGGSPSTSRPAGSTLVLNVVAPSNLADVEFGTDTTGWAFGQGYPEPGFPDAATRTRVTGGASATHFGITTARLNGTGFYNNTAGNYVVPSAAGNLIFWKWQVASNRDTATNVPQIRLRANSLDAEYNTLSVFQGATGPTTAGRTYTTVSFVDPTILTGSAGFENALDVIAFNRDATAVQGTEVRVQRFTASREIAVSSLQNAQPVWNWDFATNGQTGWSFFSLPPANGGVDATSSTNGGLGIATPGNAKPGENGTLGEFNNRRPGGWDNLDYAFGFWSRDLTTGEFQADATKIYKVEFRLATTDTNPPTARLRFNFNGPGIDDFVSEVSVDWDLRDPGFVAGPGGKTYTTYFVTPSEVNGSAPRISLDVFKVVNNRAGTVTLQSLAVTSYTLPEI